MMASPIRELLQRPVFLRMLREDTYLESLRPYVESADLTEGEEPLLDEWAKQREKEFPAWKKWAIQSLPQFKGEDPQTRDRINLRLSAMRRLDIGITGTETLKTRPAPFGGDLYVAIHLDSIQKTIKVGLPHSAKLGNDIRKFNLLSEAITSLENIEAIEDALFSLSAGEAKNDPSAWSTIRKKWQDALPLRLHEISSITNYLPKGIYSSKPVSGLVRRLDEATTLKLGQDTLQEFNLCAWWPRATEMFVAANQHLIPQLPGDEVLRDWLLQIVSNRIISTSLTAPASRTG